MSLLLDLTGKSAGGGEGESSSSTPSERGFDVWGNLSQSGMVSGADSLTPDQTKALSEVREHVASAHQRAANFKTTVQAMVESLYDSIDEVHMVDISKLNKAMVEANKQHRQQLERLRRELAKEREEHKSQHSDEEFAEIGRLYEEAKDRLNQCEIEVAERDVQIANLEEAKDAGFEQYEKEIKKLHENLTSASDKNRQTSSSKDDQIEDLTDSITNLQKKAIEKDERIKELEKQLEEAKMKRKRGTAIKYTFSSIQMIPADVLEPTSDINKQKYDQYIDFVVGEINSKINGKFKKRADKNEIAGLLRRSDEGGDADIIEHVYQIDEMWREQLNPTNVRATVLRVFGIWNGESEAGFKWTYQRIIEGNATEYPQYDIIYPRGESANAWLSGQLRLDCAFIMSIFAIITLVLKPDQWVANYPTEEQQDNVPGLNLLGNVPDWRNKIQEIARAYFVIISLLKSGKISVPAAKDDEYWFNLFSIRYQVKAQREQAILDKQEQAEWEERRKKVKADLGDELMERLAFLDRSFTKQSNLLEDEPDSKRAIKKVRRNLQVMQGILKVEVISVKEGKVKVTGNKKQDPTGLNATVKKIKKYSTNNHYQNALVLAGDIKVKERFGESDDGKRRAVDTIKNYLDILEHDGAKINKKKPVAASSASSSSVSSTTSSSSSSSTTGDLIGLGEGEEETPVTPSSQWTTVSLGEESPLLTSTPAAASSSSTQRVLFQDTPIYPEQSSQWQTPRRAFSSPSPGFGNLSAMFEGIGVSRKLQGLEELKKVSFGHTDAGSGVEMMVDVRSPFNNFESRATIKITKGVLTAEHVENPIYSLALPSSSSWEVDAKSLRVFPNKYSLGFGGGGRKMSEYRSGEYAVLFGKNVPKGISGNVYFSDYNNSAFVSVNDARNYRGGDGSPVPRSHFEINDLDSNKRNLLFTTGLYRATPHIAIYNAGSTFESTEPSESQTPNYTPLTKDKLEYFSYDLLPGTIEANISLDIVFSKGEQSKATISLMCLLKNNSSATYSSIDRITISHRPHNISEGTSEHRTAKYEASRKLEVEASRKLEVESQDLPLTLIAPHMPIAMTKVLSGISALPARSSVNIPMDSVSVRPDTQMRMSFHTVLSEVKPGNNPEKIYSEQRLLIKEGEEKIFKHLFNIKNAMITTLDGAVLIGSFLGSTRVDGTYIPFDVTNDQPAVMVTSYRQSNNNENGIDIKLTAEFIYDANSTPSIPYELLFVFPWPAIVENSVEVNEPDAFSLVHAVDINTRFYDNKFSRRNYSMVQLVSSTRVVPNWSGSFKFDLSVSFHIPAASSTDI